MTHRKTTSAPTPYFPQTPFQSGTPHLRVPPCRSVGNTCVKPSEPGRETTGKHRSPDAFFLGSRSAYRGIIDAFLHGAAGIPGQRQTRQRLRFHQAYLATLHRRLIDARARRGDNTGQAWGDRLDSMIVWCEKEMEQSRS
ncbi:hypothetical protein [Paludibacterium paludis]|uniref:hypothetical protein n=1 Tax=Paludibacterium paludis TaxID=1225769 RepID=UPI001679DD1C|nr:hypothetical protein [Paludibacterium paludis]